VIGGVAAGPARAQDELPPTDTPDGGAATQPPPTGAAQPTPPPAPSGTTSATPPSGYQVPPPPPARSERYPSVALTEDRYLESAETRDLRIPSRIATRLRVLDRDFTALSARGGSSIVDGVLAIISGGLSITLGLIIAADSEDQNLPMFLYIIGGAAVARGVIDIAMTPDPSDPAIVFSHMPMGSVREVRARLNYGESALEELADETRLARLLDAGISIGAGAGFTTYYLAENDIAHAPVLDVFLLIGAAISIVSGVINLVSRSEAERRWEAYSDLRSRLRRERRDEVIRRRRSKPTAHLGIGGVPSGAGIVLRGQF